MFLNIRCLGAFVAKARLKERKVHADLNDGAG